MGGKLASRCLFCTLSPQWSLSCGTRGGCGLLPTWKKGFIYNSWIWIDFYFGLKLNLVFLSSLFFCVATDINCDDPKGGLQKSPDYSTGKFYFHSSGRRTHVSAWDHWIHRLLHGACFHKKPPPPDDSCSICTRMLHSSSTKRKHLHFSHFSLTQTLQTRIFSLCVPLQKHSMLHEVL